MSNYKRSNAFIGSLFDFVAKGLGYQFSIAETDDALAGAYRLRRQIMSTEVFGDKVSYPDIYDQYAVVILAWYKNKIIGTMRLITASERTVALDCYNFKFPSYANLDETLEFGGLVVDRDHRGGAKIAFLGMCHLGFKYSLARRFRWWMGVATQRKIAYFRKLNTECKELDLLDPLPQHLENRNIYPSYFDGVKNTPSPFIMDNVQGSYFKAICSAIRLGS